MAAKIWAQEYYTTEPLAVRAEKVEVQKDVNYPLPPVKKYLPLGSKEEIATKLNVENPKLPNLDGQKSQLKTKEYTCQRQTNLGKNNYL